MGLHFKRFPTAEASMPLPTPSFLNSIFLPHLLHLSCRQNKQPWNFQFWFRVGISISYFDILRKRNVNFFRHNSCYRDHDPDYNIYAWIHWCIIRWLVDDPCSLSSCDTYILPPAHTNSSTYYVLFQLHLDPIIRGFIYYSFVGKLQHLLALLFPLCLLFW